VTYRQPDAPPPVDDAEARLARLAEEGRLRQTGLALRESRDRALSTQLAQTPSTRMFRARFQEKHRGAAAVVFGSSTLAFVVASFVLGSGASEIAWSIVVSVSVLGWMVGYPIWMVVRWFLVRRDADRVRAWHHGLPFRFPSFVPAISVSGLIRKNTLVARFEAAPAFDTNLVRGLLGFTSAPQAPLTIEDRELRIEGDGGAGVGPWTRELVDKVLLPLHAAHGIEEVDLRVDVVSYESLSSD
jgi:hypothetical protein